MATDEQMIERLQELYAKRYDIDCAASHFLDAMDDYFLRLLALAKAGMSLPKCWRLNERGELVQDVPVTPDMDLWVSVEGASRQVSFDSRMMITGYWDSDCYIRRHPLSRSRHVSECYATPEAAAAARAAEQEKS